MPAAVTSPLKRGDRPAFLVTSTLWQSVFTGQLRNVVHLLAVSLRAMPAFLWASVSSCVRRG